MSQYYVNKNINFKTHMQRSHLCGYGDAYIVAKGRITVRGTNDARNKKLTFKNNLPLSHKSITYSRQCRTS